MHGQFHEQSYIGGVLVADMLLIPAPGSSKHWLAPVYLWETLSKMPSSQREVDVLVIPFDKILVI